MSPVVVLHLKRRAAAVQVALGGGGTRSPLAAFSCNSNLGKIRANTMPVRQIDGRPNRNVQCRRQVNRNVPGRSLEHRIRAVGPGDELGHNAAGPGFSSRRRHAVECNAAPAGLSLHRSGRRTKTNTAAASFNYCRARNLAQLNAAAASSDFQRAGAALHLDAAAAGLEHGALHAGHHQHAATAGLRVDLSFGRSHFDAAATRAQRNLAAHGSYVNAAATGLGADHASDIIQVNAAAAGFTFDPASDARRRKIAAVSFNLHQISVTRNVDDEFAGGAARPAAFPLARHPRSVSADGKR